MKVYLVCSMLLFVSLAHCKPMTLDEPWLVFKRLYKKEYVSVEEEVARRTIWETNLAQIRKHNLEADLGLHSYHMGMNAFGDLTHEEFKKKFLGGIKTIDDTKLTRQSFDYTAEIKDFPSDIDWRTKGVVKGVVDMGQCGASWAFSATGSLEGQYAIKHNKLVPLSEQNIIDCSDPFGNDGCKSGSIINSFIYVIASKGLDTEEGYPYVGPDNCSFDPAHIGVNCTGYVEIELGSELDLQTAIATIGPVSVTIDASRSSFMFYKHGIYNEPSCSSTEVDFAGLVVGYGSDGETDYYIFKNAWGTSWGDRGYILMSRNKHNQCGIATAASYPIVV